LRRTAAKQPSSGCYWKERAADVEGENPSYEQAAVCVVPTIACSQLANDMLRQRGNGVYRWMNIVHPHELDAKKV